MLMFCRVSNEGQVLIKEMLSKINTVHITICFLCCERHSHTIQIKVFPLEFAHLFSFNSIKREITKEQLPVLQQQKPAT